MASNPAKPKTTSRWGNLLSGAVAGLESRLDNIFAEEEERARQERAAGRTTLDASSASAASATAAAAPAPAPGTPTRTASRTRVNDRLQERLAKAVANQKLSSQPSSEVPSRSVTPVVDSASPRASTSSTRPSIDVRPESLDVQRLPSTESEVVVTSQEPSTSTLLTSGLPINPARILEDAQQPTLSDEPQEEPVVVEDDVPEPKHADAPTTSEVDIPQARNEQSQSDVLRQEEMYSYLERIDALQAKLQYLAKETVAAAKEANANAQPGSLQQKIAEKDERIALLMEEGSKLSKTEMRHLATIKKLRSKTVEEEKTVSDLQKRLAKLEQSESDLKLNLKQAGQAEKQANERLKRLQKVESDLDTTKNDLESNKATVAMLRKQLADAEQRADEAERIAQDKASQADSKRVSDLQSELEDLKIEKKLAEDRFTAELKRAAEASESQKERSDAREAELMAEASNLENRIEALRSRAEQATSDVTGDSQAKLLRQIETLQTQYSLAAENWRTIEASLNSRITAVEKERDDYAKREADVRKKARDISSKSKRAEEELDRVSEEHSNLSQQLLVQKNEFKALQARCTTADKALDEARADFERQRQALEADLRQKLEEEKNKTVHHGLGIDTDMSGLTSSRNQSPTSYFRKSSAHESLAPRRNIARIPSLEQTAQAMSRRPSALALTSSRIPDLPSPGVSRQGSGFSLSQLNGSFASGIPPTPSIHTTDVDVDHDGDGDAFENNHSSSPHRTINDMISATTVHTGPSVQLVERMSSTIRRLESEKAAHRDELARLVSQRDGSRNEVVALMREAEAKREADERAARLESELGEVRRRYDACLELMGEREEEVEELKGDVVELKRIYRDLAERSMK